MVLTYLRHSPLHFFTFQGAANIFPFFSLMALYLLLLLSHCCRRRMFVVLSFTHREHAASNLAPWQALIVPQVQ